MAKLFALFGVLLVAYHIREAQCADITDSNNLRVFSTNIEKLEKRVIKIVNDTVVRAQQDYDDYQKLVETLRNDSSNASTESSASIVNPTPINATLILNFKTTVDATMEDYQRAIEELAASGSNSSRDCSAKSTSELEKIANEYIANATSCLGTEKIRNEALFDDVNIPYETINSTAVIAINDARDCVEIFNKSESVETAIHSISCLANVTTDVADSMATHYIEFKSAIAKTIKALGSSEIEVAKCDIGLAVEEFIVQVEESYDDFQACMAGDGDADSENSTGVPETTERVPQTTSA